MTPTTTVVIASVAIKSEKRSRIMASLCYLFIPTRQPALLERILFHTDEIRGVVFRRRMRAAALHVSKLLDASAQQQRRMAIVSFDAARLDAAKARQKHNRQATLFSTRTLPLSSRLRTPIALLTCGSAAAPEWDSAASPPDTRRPGGNPRRHPGSGRRSPTALPYPAPRWRAPLRRQEPARFWQKRQSSCGSS